MIQTSCQYLCTICKGKFGSENIRYSTDGKSLICADCFESLAEAEMQPQQEKAATKKMKSNADFNNEPDFVKVICVDCRYKFKLKKKSKAAIKCPYCGKSNLMKDETTAQRLVEEAGRYK